MSWRTVIITKRCKLDYKMGYLVIRAEDVKRIFLEEIALLMIENPAVSFTGCLMEELINQKIKVIFCDSRRNPLAELAPYNGSHDDVRKIKKQMLWDPVIKDAVWTRIVSEKITCQSDFLLDLKCLEEARMLEYYKQQIEPADKTNREGHAAKVYFNAVFGPDFIRGSHDPINAALDYGYTLLLSAFNREITANGYLTQIGIHHNNVFNHFNLSSDLMEPFRITVDRCVYAMDPEQFERWEKIELVDILNKSVLIGNSEQTLLNAIKIYVKSILDALSENDLKKMKFVEVYEL